MIDKQKVQRVITNLLEHEALFPEEQYISSAQKFESKLREHGFEPPIEVCHKYKLPKGYDEASFERYVLQQIYIHLFEPERVTDTEKYVKKFYADMDADVPESVQKEYLADLLKVTGALSDEEKAYVAHYFRAEQPKAVGRMKSFLPELKKLNPEIDSINPQSAFDFYNLYIGMTSRFHLEDIKYFSSLRNFDEADKNHNKIENVLEFGPGFRIEPNRTQQLIDGIIAQKQNKIQCNI